MSRLAEIYKSEKSKGGGLTSTLGKRFLEKVDPRQFFDQSGLLTLLLPTLFKKYSATGVKGIKGDKKITPASDLSLERDTSLVTKLDTLISVSNNINTNSKISAKNSMVLPVLARDMNLMRQNIVKMVKLQGGKPATRADMFFQKSQEREALYEEQYKKSKVTPSPVPSGTMKADEGGSKGIMGTLMSIALSAFMLLKNTVSGIVGAFKTLIDLLPSFSTIVEGVTRLMGLLQNALSLLLTPVGLLVGGLTVIGTTLKTLSDKLLSRAEKEGGKEGREMEAKAQNEMLMGAMDPTGVSFVTGEGAYGNKLITPEDQLKQRSEYQKEQAKNITADVEKRTGVKLSSTGRAAIIPEPPTPVVTTTPKTSPTPISSSDVSEDLVNYIKQKENPVLYKNGGDSKAFWDHKQYSIGYGTKTNNPDEVISEAEADRRLRETLANSQKSVIDYAKKYNYDFNQKQIDALTSFVYNLGPGILDQLTAKGTRSIPEIAEKIPEYNKASGVVLPGLVSRRKEEFAMFTAEPPSTILASAKGFKPSMEQPKLSVSGSRVESVTTAVAQAKTQATPPVIINSPTTNVNQAATQGPTRVAAASAYDVDFGQLYAGLITA